RPTTVSAVTARCYSVAGHPTPRRGRPPRPGVIHRPRAPGVAPRAGASTTSDPRKSRPIPIASRLPPGYECPYSLPLDRRGRFRADVVHDPVHARNLVHDPGGYPGQERIRKPRPVGGHPIAGGDRPQSDDLVVGPPGPPHPHR